MKLPIQRFTVIGKSMFPSLKPGQDILCFNWAYIFFKLKKGDIVVIKHNGREIIKRIEKIDDSSVCVIGDNREESTDSRDFGLIDKSKIIGKVIFVVR